MNHGQEPASGATHRRRGFACALIVLTACILGGAVTLIDLRRRTDADTTTTAQANVANPADTGARATR